MESYLVGDFNLTGLAGNKRSTYLLKISASDGNITSATSIFTTGPEGTADLPSTRVDGSGITYLTVTTEDAAIINCGPSTLTLPGPGISSMSICKYGPDLQPLAATFVVAEVGSIGSFGFTLDNAGRLAIPAVCGSFGAGAGVFYVPGGANFTCSGLLGSVVLRYNSTDLSYIM